MREPDRVGFVLGDHDPAGALTIDPTVVHSTYRGGAAWDLGRSVAVGYSYGGQNAIVVGATQSANVPVGGAFQGSLAGSFDAFVTKLNPAGSALTLSTYLGGSEYDEGNDIDVDWGLGANVTGGTDSTKSPTAAPFQGASGGGGDAFVTKVEVADSALRYSSNSSGSGGDFGEGIAVDNSGNFYVTGYTDSTNFPTVSPGQPPNGGAVDAFMMRIDEIATSTGHLAEGATLGGFETWVLVAKPDPALTSTVSITYLTGAGSVGRSDFVLLPQTRQPIRVNDTVSTYDISTKVVSSGASVVAERATYVTSSEYKGATDSPGTSIAASSRFLPEGSTGPGFDTRVLVANPSATITATAQTTYMVRTGAVTGPALLIPLQSRRTVKANDTVTNWDVSTKVKSTGTDVVAERAMYATAGSRFGKTAATGEGVQSAAST